MIFHPEDPSIDDALEAQRPHKVQEIQHHFGQPELTEDDDTSALYDEEMETDDHYADDHPSRDTNIDPTERYHT